MRNIAIILVALASLTPVYAEDLIASRGIKAGTVITGSDIVPPKSSEALRRAANLLGKEASRNIYGGRRISEADVRTPRIISRNAIVMMRYKKGPMRIEAEGRALDEGGAGDRIRIMNLQSKRIVTAKILDSGTVEVR
ncbi:MAG: flagellar basal body P-ring formation chaperone FlgA [Pseudomonadota bacterium]